MGKTSNHLVSLYFFYRWPSANVSWSKISVSLSCIVSGAYQIKRFKFSNLGLLSGDLSDGQTGKKITILIAFFISQVFIGG